MRLLLTLNNNSNLYNLFALSQGLDVLLVLLVEIIGQIGPEEQAVAFNAASLDHQA